MNVAIDCHRESTYLFAVVSLVNYFYFFLVDEFSLYNTLPEPAKLVNTAKKVSLFFLII